MQGSPNNETAGPGPATRTVNAADAPVSLPVYHIQKISKYLQTADAATMRNELSRSVYDVAYASIL